VSARTPKSVARSSRKHGGAAASASRLRIVRPPSLPEPRGWSDGILAPAGGRLLFVAGQAGWDSRSSEAPPGFADQFAHALEKVLAVVAEAGGGPGDVARLTIYVIDLPAYRAARRELSGIWKSRFGNYYPAMALVEVQGLVDAGALVEIEATAVIGGAS
jgi:enamine deaminase RidA (YjgF/YER057c/UK114 family)